MSMSSPKWPEEAVVLGSVEHFGWHWYQCSSPWNQNLICQSLALWVSEAQNLHMGCWTWWLGSWVLSLPGISQVHQFILAPYTDHCLNTYTTSWRMVPRPSSVISELVHSSQKVITKICLHCLRGESHALCQKSIAISLRPQYSLPTNLSSLSIPKIL